MPAPTPAPDLPRTPSALGLDVALRWGGDLHAERFLPRPASLTLGPDGDLPLPPDLLDGRRRTPLVVPDDRHGFALCLDLPGLRGSLVLDGREILLVEDVRRGVVPGLDPARVPIGPRVQAVLHLGDFSLHLARSAVPDGPRWRPWGRDQLPLLLSLGLAAGVVLGPMTAAWLAPHERQTWLADDGDWREDPTESWQPEALPEPEPERVDVAPLQPPPGPLPSRPVPRPAPVVARPQPVPVPAPVALPPGDPEARRAHVRRQVAQATQDLDAALRGGPPPVRLFAPGEGPLATPTGGEPGTSTPDFGPGGPRRPGVDEGGPVAPRALGKRVSVAAPQLDLQPRHQPVAQFRVPVPKGSLSREIVRQHLARHAGALKACYQRGLQAAPGLEGRVVIGFVIQPSGAVLGARVEEATLPDPAVQACLLDKLGAVRFPPSGDGGTTTVKYPMAFRAH